MSGRGAPVRLRVYTEDSGRRSQEVFPPLLRGVLKRVEPSTQTQLLQIEPADGDAAAAMGANGWKGKEGLRRALVRDLATGLRLARFAVLHHDGDRPWGGAPGAPAHDGAVEALLAELRRALGLPPGAPVPGLLRLVPHYSIEAWLYLNREVVEVLVEEGRAPAAALAWLDQNASPQGGYDHVPMPKDACPLHDKHNPALAARWPAGRAEAASPSLQHTVASWRADPGLVPALQATNPWAPPAPPAP